MAVRTAIPPEDEELIEGVLRSLGLETGPPQKKKSAVPQGPAAPTVKISPAIQSDDEIVDSVLAELGLAPQPKPQRPQAQQVQPSTPTPRPSQQRPAPQPSRPEQRPIELPGPAPVLPYIQQRQQAPAVQEAPATAVPEEPKEPEKPKGLFGRISDFVHRSFSPRPVQPPKPNPFLKFLTAPRRYFGVDQKAAGAFEDEFLQKQAQRAGLKALPPKPEPFVDQQTAQAIRQIRQEQRQREQAHLEPVYPKRPGVTGAVRDLGAGLAAGIGDFVGMVASLSPDRTMRTATKEIVETAQATEPLMARSAEAKGGNIARNILYEAGKVVSGSLLSTMPGAHLAQATAPGRLSTLVGAFLSAAPLYGVNEFQSAVEELTAYGVPKEKALAVAAIRGAAESGFEALGDAFTVFKIFGAMPQRSLRGIVRRFIANTVDAAIAQIPTEAATSYIQTAATRSVGVPTPFTPGEAAFQAGVVAGAAAPLFGLAGTAQGVAVEFSPKQRTAIQEYVARSIEEGELKARASEYTEGGEEVPKSLQKRIELATKRKQAALSGFREQVTPILYPEQAPQQEEQAAYWNERVQSSLDDIDKVRILDQQAEQILANASVTSADQLPPRLRRKFFDLKARSTAVIQGFSDIVKDIATFAGSVDQAFTESLTFARDAAMAARAALREAELPRVSEDYVVTGAAALAAANKIIDSIRPVKRGEISITDLVEDAIRSAVAARLDGEQELTANQYKELLKSVFDTAQQVLAAAKDEYDRYGRLIANRFGELTDIPAWPIREQKSVDDIIKAIDSLIVDDNEETELVQETPLPKESSLFATPEELALRIGSRSWQEFQPEGFYAGPGVENPKLRILSAPLETLLQNPVSRRSPVDSLQFSFKSTAPNTSAFEDFASRSITENLSETLVKYGMTVIRKEAYDSALWELSGKLKVAEDELSKSAFFADPIKRQAFLAACLNASLRNAIVRLRANTDGLPYIRLCALVSAAFNSRYPSVPNYFVSIPRQDPETGQVTLERQWGRSAFHGLSAHTLAPIISWTTLRRAGLLSMPYASLYTLPVDSGPIVVNIPDPDHARMARYVSDPVRSKPEDEHIRGFSISQAPVFADLVKPPFLKTPVVLFDGYAIPEPKEIPVAFQESLKDFSMYNNPEVVDAFQNNQFFRRLLYAATDNRGISIIYMPVRIADEFTKNRTRNFPGADQNIQIDMSPKSEGDLSKSLSQAIHQLLRFFKILTVVDVPKIESDELVQVRKGYLPPGTLLIVGDTRGLVASGGDVYVAFGRAKLRTTYAVPVIATPEELHSFLQFIDLDDDIGFVKLIQAEEPEKIERLKKEKPIDQKEIADLEEEKEGIESAELGLYPFNGLVRPVLGHHRSDVIRLDSEDKSLNIDPSGIVGDQQELESILHTVSRFKSDVSTYDIRGLFRLIAREHFSDFNEMRMQFNNTVAEWFGTFVPLLNKLRVSESRHHRPENLWRAAHINLLYAAVLLREITREVVEHVELDGKIPLPHYENAYGPRARAPISEVLINIANLIYETLPSYGENLLAQVYHTPLPLATILGLWAQGKYSVGPAWIYAPDAVTLSEVAIFPYIHVNAENEQEALPALAAMTGFRDRVSRYTNTELGPFKTSVITTRKSDSAIQGLREEGELFNNRYGYVFASFLGPKEELDSPVSIIGTTISTTDRRVLKIADALGALGKSGAAIVMIANPLYKIDDTTGEVVIGDSAAEVARFINQRFNISHTAIFNGEGLATVFNKTPTNEHVTLFMVAGRKPTADESVDIPSQEEVVFLRNYEDLINMMAGEAGQTMTVAEAVRTGTISQVEKWEVGKRLAFGFETGREEGTAVAKIPEEREVVVKYEQIAALRPIESSVISELQEWTPDKAPAQISLPRDASTSTIAEKIEELLEGPLAATAKTKIENIAAFGEERLAKARDLPEEENAINQLIDALINANDASPDRDISKERETLLTQFNQHLRFSSIEELRSNLEVQDDSTGHAIGENDESLLSIVASIIAKIYPLRDFFLTREDTERSFGRALITIFGEQVRPYIHSMWTLLSRWPETVPISENIAKFVVEVGYAVVGNKYTFRELQHIFEAHGIQDAEKLARAVVRTVENWPSVKNITEEGLQVPYFPLSNGEYSQPFVPLKLVAPIESALKNIELSEGNIDEFVARELGFGSKEELWFRKDGTCRLNSCQIDTLAIAINKLKQGRASITAHQAGLGKGRVAAALARWCIIHGYKPIFMTHQSKLFTDFFRDWRAVCDDGPTKPRFHSPNILVFNAKDNESSILEPDYESETPEEYGYVTYGLGREGDELDVSQYDIFILTYSQIYDSLGFKKRPPDSVGKQKTANAEIIGKLVRAVREIDPWASFTSVVLEYLEPRTPKQRLLVKLAEANGVLIMDESHSAAGESATSAMMRLAIAKSAGVHYLSATYAKTGTTLAAYVKTAILMYPGIEKILQDGSVTVMQMAARLLALQGELIRFELDASDIDEFNAVVVGSEVESGDPNRLIKSVQYSAIDAVSNIMRSMISIRDLIEAFVESGSLIGYVRDHHAYKRIAAGADHTGDQIEESVDALDPTDFRQVLADQVTVSLKANTAINLALESVRRGEKPVIALTYTNSTVIERLYDFFSKYGEDYSEIRSLFSRPHMAAVLTYFCLEAASPTIVVKTTSTKPGQGVTKIQGVFRLRPVNLGLITENDEVASRLYAADEHFVIHEEFAEAKPESETESGITSEFDIHLSAEQGGVLLNIWREVQTAIMYINKNFGTLASLPASPIDEIVNALTENGVKIEEITGRRYTIGSDGRQLILAPREKPEGGPKGVISRFNRGVTDAVIMNSMASTGVSMHASRDFQDQKPRRMIMLQPNNDINQVIQTMGRINRYGQVVGPRYDLVFADIPSEVRFRIILLKRFAALSASVSGQLASAIDVGDVPDMFNWLGDLVCARWAVNNSDIVSMAGHSVRRIAGVELFRFPNVSDINDWDLRPCEDAMRIFTANLIMLPAHVQESFWEQTQEMYLDRLNALIEQGRNPFVARTLNAKAKTIETEVVREPTIPLEGIGDNAVYREVIEVFTTTRPYTRSQLQKLIPQKIRKYNEILANLRQAIEDASSQEAQSYEEKKEELEKQIEELKARLEKLTQYLEENTSKLDQQQLDNLNFRIGSTKTKIQVLESKIEEIDEKIKKKDFTLSKSGLTVLALLSSFTPGRCYVVTSREQKTRTPNQALDYLERVRHEVRSRKLLYAGVFIGLDEQTNLRGINLRGLRNVKLCFAVPTPQKIAYVSLASILSSHYSIYPTELPFVPSYWDSLLPVDNKEIRTVITGDIFRALSEIEFPFEPDLATMTWEDGRVRDVILLPHELSVGKGIFTAHVVGREIIEYIKSATEYGYIPPKTLIRLTPRVADIIYDPTRSVIEGSKYPWYVIIPTPKQVELRNPPEGDSSYAPFDRHLLMYSDLAARVAHERMQEEQPEEQTRPEPMDVSFLYGTEHSIQAVIHNFPEEQMLLMFSPNYGYNLLGHTDRSVSITHIELINQRKRFIDPIGIKYSPILRSRSAGARLALSQSAIVPEGYKTKSVPALYRRIGWSGDSIHLELGGREFPSTQYYLEARGVNVRKIYDADTLKSAIEMLSSRGELADSVAILSAEKYSSETVRAAIVAIAAALLKTNGVLYISFSKDSDMNLAFEEIVRRHFAQFEVRPDKTIVAFGTLARTLLQPVKKPLALPSPEDIAIARKSLEAAVDEFSQTEKEEEKERRLEEAQKRLKDGFVPTANDPEIEVERDIARYHAASSPQSTGRDAATAPSVEPIMSSDRIRILDLRREIAKRFRAFVSYAGVVHSDWGGYYNPRNSGIVAQTPNDIPIIVHEVFHKIGDTYLKTLYSDARESRETLFPQLMALGKASSEPPSSAPEIEKENYILDESVAIFAEWYMANPRYMIETYNAAYTYLKRKIPEKIWKDLDYISEQYRKWFGQDTANQILSNVSTIFSARTNFARFLVTLSDYIATLLSDKNEFKFTPFDYLIEFAVNSSHAFNKAASLAMNIALEAKKLEGTVVPQQQPQDTGQQEQSGEQDSQFSERRIEQARQEESKATVEDLMRQKRPSRKRAGRKSFAYDSEVPQGIPIIENPNILLRVWRGMNGRIGEILERGVPLWHKPPSERAPGTKGGIATLFESFDFSSPERAIICYEFTVARMMAERVKEICDRIQKAIDAANALNILDLIIKEKERRQKERELERITLALQASIAEAAASLEKETGQKIPLEKLQEEQKKLEEYKKRLEEERKKAKEIEKEKRQEKKKTRKESEQQQELQEKQKELMEMDDEALAKLEASVRETIDKGTKWLQQFIGKRSSRRVPEGTIKFLNRVRASLLGFTVDIGKRPSYKTADEFLRDLKEGNFLEVPYDLAIRLDEITSKAAEAYRSWARAILQYALDGEYISEEEFSTLLEDNQNYVAMHLADEEIEDLVRTQFFKAPASSSLGSKIEVLWPIFGMAREKQDPYVSLFLATDRFIRETDRNNILRTFNKYLSVRRKMGTAWGPYPLASIGHKVKRTEKKTIPVRVPHEIRKKGVVVRKVIRTERWKYNDHVYRAISSIGDDFRIANPVLKVIDAILQKTGQVFRHGVVYHPAFAIKNMLKDTSMRTLTSKHGLSLPRLGFKDEELHDLEFFGGSQAGPYYGDKLNYAMAMRRVMRMLAAKSGKGKLFGRKVLLVTKPIETYINLIERAEVANRVAEFRKAYEYARKKLGIDDEYQAGLYAAAMARRAGTDWAVVGSALRWARRYLPFVNPSIQGAAVLYQAVKDRPRMVLLNFLLFIVLPGLLLYALMARSRKTLREYRNIPAELRATFYVIPVGAEFWLFIPKTWTAGTLEWGVESVIDYFMGNHRAIREFSKHAPGLLAPIDLPSFIGVLPRTFMEVTADFDMYTQRRIVPEWERKLDISERSGARHASVVGQKIAPIFRTDPRVVDHVINSVLGSTGGSLLLGSDMLLGKPVPWTRFLRLTTKVAGSMPITTTSSFREVMEFMARKGFEQGVEIPLDQAESLGLSEGLFTVRQRGGINPIKDLREQLERFFVASKSGNTRRAAMERERLVLMAEIVEKRLQPIYRTMKEIRRENELRRIELGNE